MQRRELKTPSERLRAALQGTNQGSFALKMAKYELNLMTPEPEQYIKDYNNQVLILNTNMKYDLLEGLKLSSIQKYTSKEIIRVMIQKANGLNLPLWNLTWNHLVIVIHEDLDLVEELAML